MSQKMDKNKIVEVLKEHGLKTLGSQISKTAPVGVTNIVTQAGSGQYDGVCFSKNPNKKKIIYTNYYLCECGTEWNNKYDCACNDRCPQCRTEIMPYASANEIMLEEIASISRQVI